MSEPPQIDIEAAVRHIIAKQRAMARAFKGGGMTRKQRAQSVVRAMKKGRLM